MRGAVLAAGIVFALFVAVVMLGNSLGWENKQAVSVERGCVVVRTINGAGHTVHTERKC